MARSAGLSAWQFVTPALVVAFVLGIDGAPPSTTRSRPYCRSARNDLKLNYSDMLPLGSVEAAAPFWIGQRTDEGQAIINAVSSRDQGINLNGVSVFTFDTEGRFKQRIEARDGRTGAWRHGVLATPASMRWAVLPAEAIGIPSQDQPYT